MEYKMATIPFDLETAKKINIGEIAGRIVTEKGQNRAEIVYEDNSSNCPLLVVIHSISVSADWFSATGKALSSANRLLLKVPEYTTFKDGEVLSNKDGSYIFILNTHGKYLTSFYASLNQKGILKIEDGLSAWENKIEKYRFATESERQKLVDALKASKEPEAKEYLKRFFGIEEKLKYDFKPFDKVLAKYYEDDNWEASLFIRTITDDQDGETKYECLNGTVYVYCIPFEGNEYLLGTTENPEKMKMVKLSDFYPYDRNKGGIQELHHKIESKTLQYWGEDSGILIGITPIYKRRLWSEEVKVVNDKMTNMKTRTYEGVQHGDWVRCVLCGAQMLLPCGADKCPECSSEGTLTWVDEDKQEMDAKHLDCLVPIRKLELQEYLSPEILKMEHI